MHPLAHHFLTMAYNNAWSNHRLLKACAQLSQADFVAPRVSFFPSLKATMNHNLTVDWYYVDAMERSVRGQPVNQDARQFFDPEEPFETCADIWREQKAVDARLIELCRHVGDADSDLEQPVRILRSAGVKVETLTRILAHLFEHQIHHRGQAHAMLAGTKIAPPQLDEFFCEGDRALREPDFVELGFDEAVIWARR